MGLLAQPDLLLLDEPTNHLDAESVRWLESSTSRSTQEPLFAITHDRYFLDNVAEWILELDRGRAYPYEGNYLDLPRGEGCAPEGRGVRRTRSLQKRLVDELGMGSIQSEGSPGEEQVPTWSLRRWPPRPAHQQVGLRGDPDSRVHALEHRGWATGLTKGSTTASSLTTFRVLASAQRHRGCDRTERRWKDHPVQMIVGQERPTVDRSRLATQSRFRMLTRVGVGSTRKKNVWKSSPMASTTLKVAGQDADARVRQCLWLQGS